MKITRDDILHVAKLAHLNLDERAIDTYAEQISTILDYVDKLEKIDTEDVPATTHAISLTNAFREDKVKEHLSIEKTLANAPDREARCFVVPKIVG